MSSKNTVVIAGRVEKAKRRTGHGVKARREMLKLRYGSLKGKPILKAAEVDRAVREVMSELDVDAQKYQVGDDARNVLRIVTEAFLVRRLEASKLFVLRRGGILLEGTDIRYARVLPDILTGRGAVPLLVSGRDNARWAKHERFGSKKKVSAAAVTDNELADVVA